MVMDSLKNINILHVKEVHMRNSRMRLCDTKYPTLGFSEYRLQDERLDNRVLENNKRWKFYGKR
jgi:hypothetical protein